MRFTLPRLAAVIATVAVAGVLAACGTPSSTATADSAGDTPAPVVVTKTVEKTVPATTHHAVKPIPGGQVSSSTPPTTAHPKAAPSPVSTPDGSDDASFEMPDEVGNGLQDAQDDVQAVSGNPLFYTSSQDATGSGRHQILDRDWTVCSQTPTAGTPVDDSSDITFYVVKLSESCP